MRVWINGQLPMDKTLNSFVRYPLGLQH